MTEIKTEIPIVHCFDNNYVIPAAVSFMSMLTYADPKYKYSLYVLHSDITVQNQQKLTELVADFDNASLQFVDMNNRLEDFWVSSGLDCGRFSKELLYKLLMPSLFPQYRKIIVTDVDVVFTGDVAPSFFSLDEHLDAYYAGVRQINPTGTLLRKYYNNTYRKRMDEEENSQLKICGGYFVANLEGLRKDGMEAVMLDYITKNSSSLFQPEQDVMNFCCRDRQIVYLPLNYVVCSYMYDQCDSLSVLASDPYYTFREMQDAMEHPIQLHYATPKKPWLDDKSSKADVWFDVLKQTAFQKDYEKQNEARAEHGALPDCPCRDRLISPDKAFNKKVSVVCCTYNHEKFITEALEGILNQKTNFDFEVIVADDASTDSTPGIISDFQRRYPERMSKVILRKENVGIGENYYDALNRAEGQYLAICDGDDCWTDENKLQMQVEYLEKNPDYTVVCSDFVYHYIDGKLPDTQFNVYKYIGAKKDAYSVKDLMFSRFIASCTVMFRWQFPGTVPEFVRHYQVIDFSLTLLHASMGYIGVLEQVTAKYNVHSSSISNDKNTDVVIQSVQLVKEVNQYCDFALTKLQDDYMSCLRPAKTSASSSVVKFKKISWLKKLKKHFAVIIYLFYQHVIPASMHGFFLSIVPRKLRNQVKANLR